MELIKIDKDHFVVVNKTIQPVNGYYYDSFINKIKSTNGAEYGEASHCWQITHSTQPLDTIILKNRDHSQSVGHYYGNGGQLSIQEVKELIGEVDVEKKAQEYLGTFGTDQEYQGFKHGYSQALEDNKEKQYTEEDLKKMWKLGYNERNLDDSIESTKLLGR